MPIRWWPIGALCLSGAPVAVPASYCLYFTCLQGTVRRGGNKSWAPAAVQASQCLYFTCFQGTVRRGGNKSEAPAAVSASQCLYFLLAHSGLSEEEGTSQELQQLFQFHNIFIFYLLTGVLRYSCSFSFTISLFFTCLQGTVRRGGNKSGAPAAVSASQCLYQPQALYSEGWLSISSFLD